MTTYRVTLGRLIERWIPADIIAPLDLVRWTEPITYETDDRDEVDAIVLDALAAHPEFTRAKVQVVP